MKRPAGFLLLALSVTPAALGHGGLYRGPGPTIPPTLPGSGPGTGPTLPGGPGTGGGGGAGPITGGGGSGLTAIKKTVQPDYTDWYTWWEFNREPYLDLRASLGSMSPATGVSQQQQTVRPTFAEMEPAVVPALLDLLKENDADVVDSAVLALARMTPAERAEVVRPGILGALGHSERSVQQAAILALGVLGERSATPTLVAILEDAPEARRQLKQQRDCDDVQRGLAAVALGLLSDPEALDALQRTYDRCEDSQLEVKASVLLALGLYSENQYAAVAALRGALAERRASEVIQAQVPIALMRIGDAAGPLLPDLLHELAGRKTRNGLRQSCAAALGQLAVPEDNEAIEALMRVVEKASDDGSGNFAAIALGQIAGRAAADPRGFEAMLKDVDRFLMRQVSKPGRRSMLPFAATGGALAARACAAEDPRRATWARLLDATFEETRQPEHRAALAVAMGLLGADTSGAAVMEALADTDDSKLQGYLAEALGLMRHQAARDLLSEGLKEASEPAQRVKFAEALGLLGDTAVTSVLLDELRRGLTLWDTAAVAKALGRVGDRSAVKPLLELAKDRKRPGLARAFCIVALGLLGEKTPVPWNTRIRAGSNYLAPFYVQREVQDIL